MNRLSDDTARVERALLAGVDPAERPRRAVDLAAVLMAKGRREDAARLALAVAGNPASTPHVAARARHVLGTGVPAFHIPLLASRARADAYDEAIRLSVTPGALVLDIGTGSGLLAMMAARAGAELVVACEQDPLLASVAERVVEANGLASRVRIVAKRSQDLVAGVDLPRRADLVVSEIVSNDLLRQQALDALAHARAELLTPSAAAIPSAGTIHIALAAGSPGRGGPVGDIAGFDMSHFNVVAGAAHQLADDAALTLLSEPAALFRVDLSGADHAREQSVELELVAREAGTLVGLLQWASLDMGHGITIDTTQPSYSRVWASKLYPLDRARAIESSQKIPVHGWRDRTSVLAWLP